ncbi:SGNH/GDSL hydrolase family protein [Sphaerisporangium sp. NPDC051017]|uniref:SGNH/GDSL hydrolase family protein n=1 Tax=Sphaerisporangium sp. NPDC051017 TaxID=3154636 RepID=UPI00342936EA
MFSGYAHQRSRSRRFGTAVTILATAVTSAVAPDVASASGAPRAHTALAAPWTAGPPEAAGPPASEGRRAVESVLGLGDSVPAGSGCDCVSYVALVAEALSARQGTPVAGSNLAAAGLTTQGLLDMLDDDTVRAGVAGADLTVITIGANDFAEEGVEDDSCGVDLACYGTELARLRANMDTLLSRIHALRGPGGRVVVTGYWNVFLDGAAGRARGPKYAAGSDRLTVAVNEALAASAAASGVLFADLYTAFKGEDGTRDDTALLAADGDHPGAAGHRLIAETVLSALAGPDPRR